MNSVPTARRRTESQRPLCNGNLHCEHHKCGRCRIIEERLHAHRQHDRLGRLTTTVTTVGTKASCPPGCALLAQMASCAVRRNGMNAARCGKTDNAIVELQTVASASAGPDKDRAAPCRAAPGRAGKDGASRGRTAPGFVAPGIAAPCLLHVRPAM